MAALLVGVSPPYYIRLERGDATGVSVSVIDGIANALKLDEAERAHLIDLLRIAGAPTRPRRPRRSASNRVRPTIEQLVDAMPTVPAVVLNARLDVLATNSLGRALFSPWYATGEPINNARLVFFVPSATSFFREWETVANDTVALLRAEAGRNPYDRELTDLVGELCTRSEDFRVRWATHDVRIHSTGIKRLHHPLVGDLDLSYESLPVELGATTSLVTYLSEPGSRTQDALALLASWAVTGSRLRTLSHLSRLPPSATTLLSQRLAWSWKDEAHSILARSLRDPRATARSARSLPSRCGAMASTSRLWNNSPRAVHRKPGRALPDCAAADLTFLLTKRYWFSAGMSDS